LREIYIDAELDPVDTTSWYPKIQRKDFTVGLNVTETGVDDPDQQFYENYVCGSDRNYTGYCNPELDKMVDRQSMETDQDKRKQLVWEIERTLVEDVARPVIFYPRGATCRKPELKGLTIMVNSIYNGWRYEDAWVDCPATTADVVHRIAPANSTSNPSSAAEVALRQHQLRTPASTRGRYAPIPFSNGSRGGGSFVSDIDAGRVTAFSTCSCGT